MNAAHPAALAAALRALAAISRGADPVTADARRGARALQLLWIEAKGPAVRVISDAALALSLAADGGMPLHVPSAARGLARQAARVVRQTTRQRDEGR